MKTDSDIIDDLGGTSKVAALCDVAPPSVSEWRRNGIPKARRMFLEVARPDVFGPAASTPPDTPELAQAAEGA